MSLVAAAVCPHPPLLVPEVAAGAAGDLEELRAACDGAVAALRAVEPDELVVVGTGPPAAQFAPPYRVSFRRYGLAADRLDDPELPLSLSVGVWLLGRAGAVPARARAVDGGAPAAECIRIGVELAGVPRRIALLVMGDGSACRDDGTPGFTEPRAAAFDATVAHALGKADLDTLRSLDPALAAGVRAHGRAAWQVLAGAAEEVESVEGELRYDAAPFGVGYFVAVWRCG